MKKKRQIFLSSRPQNFKLLHISFYTVRLETGELIKLSSRTAVNCLQDRLPKKFIVIHPPNPYLFFFNLQFFSSSSLVHSLYAARKGSSAPPSFCSSFLLPFLAGVQGGGCSFFFNGSSSLSSQKRFGGATAALHTPGLFSHEKATLPLEWVLLLQAIARCWSD